MLSLLSICSTIQPPNVYIIYVLGLALTSLESLGRDETFKSLESLVRLFQKVSQIIILFFLMFLAGKLFEKHNNYDIWKKLMHRNAIKMAEGVKIVGYFLKYGLLD